MSLMKRTLAQMPLDRLLGLVTYDAQAGRLYRRHSTGKRSAGDEAGYVNNEGYRLVWLDGRYYLAHRLVWFIETQTWPEHEIDHVNGRRDDNRFSNLRAATRSDQTANTARYRTNKSGFKGVCRVPSGWQATIRKHGVGHYLGTFPTPEQAHAAYLSAAKVLHGEFAFDGERPAPSKAVQEGLPL